MQGTAFQSGKPMSTFDEIHGRPLDAFTDSNLCGDYEDMCKSTSGFTIMHLFHLISWKSKLQPITATSSFEAELIALTYGADEVMWLRKTISELWFCYPTMTETRTPIETSEEEGITAAINSEDALNDSTSSDSDVLVRKTIIRAKEDDRSPWHTSWKYIQKYAPTTIVVDNQAVQFSVVNPDTNKTRSRHLDMRLFKTRDYVKDRYARVLHIGTAMNIADVFTKPLGKTLFKKFTSLFMAPRAKPF